MDQCRFDYFRLFLYSLLFKFFCSEPNVITSNTGSIIQIEPFLKIMKIVFKFLFKYPLRERESNLGIVTVSFVHLPCSFQSCPVFFLKYMVRIDDKVVKIIRCSKHRDRNIIVITTGIAQIYFLAMISDSSQLEFYLLHNRFVLFWIQLISRRRYIDQSSNQTRLRICNLDRLIRSHKQETFEPV